MVDRCWSNDFTYTETIIIGNSVINIEDDAFYGCRSINTVINLSNFTFFEGSSDYGHIAYCADKVINAPNRSIEGDYVFGKPNAVNTLVAYIKTTILHMPLLHTILLKQLLKRNVVKKKE